MSTATKANTKFIAAVKANDVKKARRALVRMMGACKRSLARKVKSGDHKTVLASGVALAAAQGFNRSAMKKCRAGVFA